MFHERIDMTGKVVGRLTVVEYYGIGGQHRAMWLCDCACGRVVVVSGTLLRAALNGKSSSVQSCGCLRVDASTKTIMQVSKLRRVGGNYFPRYGETR